MGWISGEYNQAYIFTKTTIITLVKNNIWYKIFDWRRKDIFMIEAEGT